MNTRTGRPWPHARRDWLASAWLLATTAFAAAQPLEANPYTRPFPVPPAAPSQPAVPVIVPVQAVVPASAGPGSGVLPLPQVPPAPGIPVFEASSGPAPPPPDVPVAPPPEQ